MRLRITIPRSSGLTGPSHTDGQLNQQPASSVCKLAQAFGSGLEAASKGAARTPLKHAAALRQRAEQAAAVAGHAQHLEARHRCRTQRLHGSTAAASGALAEPAGRARRRSQRQQSRAAQGGGVQTGPACRASSAALREARPGVRLLHEAQRRESGLRSWPACAYMQNST